MKLKIHIRNKEYIINENDLILDNGCCYQLITRQKNYKNKSHPIISKKMFKDLNTLLFVYTNEKLKEKAKELFSGDFILYKFDIKRMSKFKEYRIEGEVYE